MHIFYVHRGSNEPGDIENNENNALKPVFASCAHFETMFLAMLRTPEHNTCTKNTGIHYLHLRHWNTIPTHKILEYNTYAQNVPDVAICLALFKTPEHNANTQNLQILLNANNRMYQNSILPLQLVVNTFVSKSLGELRYTLRGPTYMYHLLSQKTDSNSFHSLLFTPKHF